MTLVLQGIALDDQPISQPLVGRFDERGGTLGRSDTVTFTLPDPERTISRLQAQVLHGDDGYWLENVSAANPILHNDRPLSSGMRVLLREGDELTIGAYTLRAAFEQDESSATILRGRTIMTHPGAGPVTALHRVPTPEGVADEPVQTDESVKIKDSAEDLWHPLGVEAGMRAALEAVLDRFDPTTLEATLGERSLLESLQPMRHKARLWQLYLEHFRSLRRETQEDFQHSVGNAFREAYEARMHSASDTDHG
jgi:predicted component of type VI protein secretion system